MSVRLQYVELSLIILKLELKVIVAASKQNLN